MQGNQLIFIKASESIDWANRDRGDYGVDAENMAEDLKENGQKQPILVRQTKDQNLINQGIHYEVIDGTCRRSGAMILESNNHDFKLSALVSEMTDEDAHLTQYLSHKNNPLCVYDEARSIQNTMNALNLILSDFAKKVGYEKSMLSKRLCVFNIPNEFWNKVENKTKITQNAAYSMSKTLNAAKAENEICYQETLNKVIALAPYVESSNDEDSTFFKKLKELENQFKKKKKVKVPQVIRSRGKELYKINPDGDLSIYKKVMKKIINNEMMDEFSQELQDLINRYTDVKEEKKEESTAA